MLKSYRMTRQSIIKYYDKDMPSQECSFKIFVEGLEEERPSLRCNDRVLVSHPKIEEKFIMVITHIIDCEIIVRADERFHRVYESCHLYNIEFVYNNYPERCCHYALNLVNKYNLVKCMFPADSIRSTIFLKETADNSKIFASSYQWFNNDIKHNKQQVQAIHKIITKSSRDTPYILYGPPGTGKTATIVEAICQAWKIIQQSDDPSKRILVCTPSNTSADVVAKRLRVYLKAKLLHRMYSLSTDIDTIDKDLLDCCNYRNGEVVMFSAYELPSIIVTTLCTCTRLIFLRLQPTNFSFIFIDEAGQANEAETIIPFTLSSNGSPEYKGRLHSQIILSGDPKQLGPTVFSRLAKPLLSISMLERLMSSDPYKKNRNGDYNPNYITKLIENYRSHPAIIHTSNKMFYNGELRSFESEDVRKGEGWKGLSNPKFPIKFDIVLGEEEKHHWTSSVYNTRELSSVMRHVHLLLDAKFGTRTLKGKDIGIITPFTSQKIRIKKLLKEANIVDIEVGTVQLFQGKEKEVMIFSTVRNKIFINDGTGDASSEESSTPIPTQPIGRIIGGMPISIESAPWQVSLQALGSHLCGGSLVSSRHVLTAAHCLSYPAPFLTARLASSKTRSGGIIRPVTSTTKHPDYKLDSSGVPSNDIGIVKLGGEPIMTISTLGVPRIVDLIGQGEVSLAGEPAMVLGWGRTAESGPTSEILQAVNLPVVGKTECNWTYARFGGIREGQMCAGALGGEGDCQGDSGGPLLIGGKQVGIVSWGYGCARPGWPGVYTEVASYRIWIDQQIAADS
ncbi:hypothetical protein QAD02_012291 [Eretmocerus hayati]|uniref:Uncharacterized protein n=1 Tax=Eretmocerus hayati TaxID=131215 RepID=A0ACC2P1V5_9HYME|nr:hypothetical protein QAD02_012291 [Eretmocerus hayati]